MSFVSYSCVRGDTFGVGNIDADPLFVDPDGADDIDGYDRFVDDPDTEDTGVGDPPIVDMGACEYQGVCVADVDVDGDVGFQDLLTLLAAWGPCAGCPADVDGDGEVGFQDLLAMLAGCP